MNKTPHPPTRSTERGLARYVTALFAQCQGWKAATRTGKQDTSWAVVQSPSGREYALVFVSTDRLLDREAVLELSQTAPHPPEDQIFVSVAGYTPEALESVPVHKLWTLEEIDYLVMAADLESNAPLAFLGLDTSKPLTDPRRLERKPAQRHAGLR